MKKNSHKSLFSANELVKRFFSLNVEEGTFAFFTDENEWKANKKEGKGKRFSLLDIMGLLPNFSNGGKSIDFSGEKQYPFPFTVTLE
jgi:hypothetical protein